MQVDDESNPHGGKFYISRLRFRGFKSFKSSEIELPQGFVALAGPNGSGKSNVTDAIRFVLGESSLKSLRAKKVTELINQNSTKAEVTLWISGEKKFEIRRAIREDGKTSYHLDGRHLTRTQVLEALRPYRIEVGSHNIIAQGQVQRIVEMNSKERRGIIDAAAGIAEFDEKKKEALGELGKVEQRISEAKILLAERGTFLSELEREKDAALSYQEAQTILQRARATQVHSEFEKLEKHFSELLEKRKAASDELDRLEGQYKVLSQRRGELEEKRKGLAEKLSKGGERDKLLSQIKAVELQIGQNEVRLEEKSRQIGKMGGEISSLKEEGVRVKKAIADMAGEEKQQVGTLKELKAALEEAKKKAGIRDEAKEEEGVLSGAEKKLSQLLQEKAGLGASVQKGGQIEEMAARKVAGIEEEIARLKAHGGDGAGKEEKYSGEIAGLTAGLEKLFDNEKELNRRIPSLDRLLLEKKEAIATLRGSVSPAAQNNALLFVGQLQKGGMGGIHGTVAELVEVDEKYRVAVEAAAGGRLTYVVVDSIDIANSVIRKLKEGKVGRCTFIPLDRPMGSDSAAPSAGLGRLIDFVKYGKKFYAAASYAFGDTIVCESVDAAKKIGIGKYRMVTVEGELIERSGIITGGTMRGSMMARSSLAKAEGEAEKVKAERDGAYAQAYEIREEMAKARKERAEFELKLREVLSQSGSAIERARKVKELGGELEIARKEQSHSLAEIELEKKKLAQVEDESGKAASHVEELKKKAEAAEEKRRKISTDAQEKYREALEKYTNLESQLSSKKREQDMLNSQLSELQEKTSKLELELKGSKRAVEEIENEKGGLEKQKNGLEEQMRQMSASVQKLYDQMQSLQKELEDIGGQIGKIDYAKNAKSRECTDVDVRKASVETKLADVKAEWERYAGVPLLDAGAQQLEEMRKTSEAKLAMLGNVNMKAPEMYGQRKKEHEEMQGRVGTLESEKAAVMQLMDEIEGKKHAIFMETFQVVNGHFQKLFKLVFRGEGMLLLDEPSSPLESGLNFRVRGEHDKKDRYLNSMSGGEQSLLALMFIFALQMHRPAPFYILDEAEAALDKENSRKLVEFVGKMSKNAQFIVVTHNDAVLSSADVALGVMKTDDGSKIVGVQLANSAPLAPGNTPPKPSEGGPRGEEAIEARVIAKKRK